MKKSQESIGKEQNDLKKVAKRLRDQNTSLNKLIKELKNEEENESFRKLYKLKS